VSFGDLKLLYVLSCLGLGFIILFPTLSIAIRLPAGERFSEFWILGSEHKAENYPFDIKAHEDSRVYLGIANHMGGLQFYVVCVKLRNETESSATVDAPSPIQPLYTYCVFLEDGTTWESSLIFSLANVSFSENQASIRSLIINGVTFSTNKLATWDSENNGYYCELFAELWICNTQSNTLQFHNRFVGIWLNITRTT
jgi:hypothetical protein